MDNVMIDRSKLPPEEHAIAAIVERNLHSLRRAVEDFRASFELYLHAHTKKIMGGVSDTLMISWIKIAGRNGAIVAYDAQQVMEAINSVHAPSLTGLMKMDDRKAAMKVFATEFPAIAAIRNSTAHPGWVVSTSKKFDDQRLTETSVGPWGVIGADSYFSESMNAFDDKLIFSTTFSGKPANYELSLQKAEAFARVYQLYNAAFYPLESDVEATEGIELTPF